MRVRDNPLVTLIEECIRFRDSAQRALSAEMGGPQLSRLEGLVLLSIAEAAAPVTAAQVGRNLGHARQVTQRAANRLVELGLLRRLPNPDHKAAPLLQPTAKGQKFESEMVAALFKLVGSLFTDSEIKACQRLGKDIRKLRMTIEAAEK